MKGFDCSRKEKIKTGDMQGKKGENDRKWFKMELMQRTRWMDTGRKGRRVRRVMMKSEKRQIEKAKEEILQ